MSFKIREAHWEVLLSFMENNRDFALGRVSGLQSREKMRKMWQKLATELNSLGFGEKTPDKWQKTWTDFKYILKKKGSQIKQEQIATGGGPQCTQFLNAFEQRALNILGGKSFYEGLGIDEIGISSKRKSLEDSSLSSPVSKITTMDGRMESLVEFRKLGASSSASEMTSMELPSTSGSQHNKENDHDYLPPPPKKKRKGGEPIEEAYIQTINVLKQINKTVDEKLTDIKDVLDSRLKEIVDSFKNK